MKTVVARLYCEDMPAITSGIRYLRRTNARATVADVVHKNIESVRVKNEEINRLKMRISYLESICYKKTVQH